MEYKRSESFRIALDALRAELRAGTHAPEARLTAKAISERLSLSATPVREALSRLAGEGLLLDRRGQGFFVPRLDDRDIANLFHLQRDLLLIAARVEVELAPLPDRDAAEGRSGAPPDPSAAVATSEVALRSLAQGAGPPLIRHFTRLQDQLAPIRALEPAILEGLGEELLDLLAALRDPIGEQLHIMLRGFYARRIGAAGALARAALRRAI